MAKRDTISMSVIRRLPRYYRFLNQLNAAGVTRISSKELSVKMGLTASQIRQDLNCFGGFGQQGYGYLVSQLCSEIGSILGISSGYKAILVGAGNLGQAIASHMSFETHGFRLIGIFDSSPFKIGTTINGIRVEDVAMLDKFCREQRPVMAVLCTPKEAVSELSDHLYALGVKSFWNFSHYDFSNRHPDAFVENVHSNDSMMTLCYRIHNRPSEPDGLPQAL